MSKVVDKVKLHEFVSYKTSMPLVRSRKANQNTEFKVTAIWF